MSIESSSDIGRSGDDPRTRMAARNVESEQASPPPQLPPPPVSLEQRMVEAYQALMGGNPGRRYERVRKESMGLILWNGMLGTTLVHPFRLVKVLIQLGHEPVEPQRRFSFLFQRYMYYYPGLFGYLRAIAHDEGWTGLYRGFGTNFVRGLVSITTFTTLRPLIVSAVSRIPMPFYRIESGDVPDTEPDDSMESMAAILTRGSRMFLSTILTNFAVELIVRPFQVIAIRSVAQAVGKETVYNGVWSSAVEIYQTQGLRGFYSGLVPALLGHLCTVVIHSSLWLMFEIISANVTHQIGKTVVKSFIAMPILAYVPGSYSYPFFLMSNLMVVNNVGLAAGSPPYAPVYDGWRDCYRHLKSTGNLYRGSVVLFGRFAYKDPPV